MPDTRPPLSRRRFLGAGAASPALAAAPRARVQVGAHPWVYAARQPDRDPTPVLSQIFSEFSRAGMDSIELMGVVLTGHEDGIRRVRELSKRHNLPVVGASWSAPMWKREERAPVLAAARSVIERIAAVGGRTLGVSVGDARHRKTPAELDAQADALREVLRMGADHGVTPNLHNHVYEVADGEHDVSGTIARIPEVKLGPDVGWLFRAKVDPVDFIRRHGSRIVFLHLRDETADGKWPETIGEGIIDFPGIGLALREAGFSGDLVIELAHERDFVPTRSYGESFRLGREHIRRAMKY